MPIRGALFVRFKKLQAQRHEAERKKSIDRRLKETKELKKLVGLRKRKEAEGALLGAIAREKSRIKAARKPTKIGMFTKSLEKAAIKEIKKRKISVTFNSSGKKRKKKRKKR